MSIEAYKVAVKLQLVENVSRGLAALSPHFLKADQNAKQLEKTLARIGKMTLAGGALAAGGAFSLGLLKGPLDAAKEYELAAKRFEGLNLGAAVNKQAQDYSQSMKGFSSSATQALDSVREAYGLLGDMSMGDKFSASTRMVDMAKANAALYKINEDGASRAMLKFADVRGNTDTIENFNRSLDVGQKMVVGSGGAIKYNDIAMLAQHGGMAFRGLSDEGLFHLSSAIQEKGGAKTATSVKMAYQNLVKGSMTKDAMHGWVGLGLGDIQKQQVGYQGGVPTYANRFVANTDLAEQFSADPVMAVYEKIIPAIYKKYGDVSEARLKQIISQLFSNSNAADLIGGIATQKDQVMRDYENTKRAAGVEQSIENYQQTLQGRIDQYEARVTDLKIQLGQTLLPMVVSGLTKLNGAIESMVRFTKEYPNITRLAVDFVVLASGLMLVAGGALLLKSTFMGLGLVVSLLDAGAKRLAAVMLLNPFGIAIAAAFMLYNNWQEISAALKTMWTLIKTGFIQLFHGDILGAWHSFAGVFLTFFQTLINTINTAVNTILPDSWRLGKLTFADDYNREHNNDSKHIGPHKTTAIQVNSSIQIGGKEIANVVTTHLANSLGRPSATGSNPDPMRGPLPVPL